MDARREEGPASVIETPAQYGLDDPASLSEASDPLVRLEKIEKRWCRNQPPVLDCVSLEVPARSVMAVAGRNGAGKTTLLRIIGGLLVPDHGSVTVCGLVPGRQRGQVNRRIGFLLAGNGGLYARLNVEHHLDLWARLALMPRAERREAIIETSATFALAELRGIRVDRLSMGQRQRLRLAMTFLHRPDLVLLDEPYTSLDADALAMLRAAVRLLRNRGGSAIICSPEPEQAKLAHDKVFLLEHGALVTAQ